MKKNLDEIVDNYLAAALWTEEEEIGGDLSIHDFSIIARGIAKTDVQRFMDESKTLTNLLSEEMIGHDMWLTRNGHGAGFWDRNLGQIGDDLSAIATKMGSTNIFLSEEGKVEFGF